jgi:hypothetical protein
LALARLSERLINFGALEEKRKSADMSEAAVVLEIDEPHFTVRLYKNMLQIDLKGSFKNTIEEALENKPLVKETIGGILGIFVPLHVRLGDIDAVDMDETGKVRINLPHHRDLAIPLDLKNAKKLVDKLHQLIPEAKKKELERFIKEQKLRKIAREEEKMEHSALVTPGISNIVQPPGVLEKEKEAEERIEEEEEKED